MTQEALDTDDGRLSTAEQLAQAKQHAGLQEAPDMQIVAHADVHPSPMNFRHYFDEDKLTELAISLLENGIESPLLVRARAGGGYEIIDGERRWRAAQIAELAQVPVIIREVPDDRQYIAMAVAANEDRVNLNPIERAQAFKTMQDTGYTREEIGRLFHVVPTQVAHTVRLLDFEAPVLDAIARGAIPEKTAELLTQLAGEPAMLEVAVAQIIHGRMGPQGLSDFIRLNAQRAPDGSGARKRTQRRAYWPKTVSLEPQKLRDPEQIQDAARKMRDRIASTRAGRPERAQAITVQSLCERAVRDDIRAILASDGVTVTDDQLTLMQDWSRRPAGWNFILTLPAKTQKRLILELPLMTDCFDLVKLQAKASKGFERLNWFFADETTQDDDAAAGVEYEDL